MKKVLFAASESMPYIKTGGLADVIGSLPKCFPRDEFDVRIIIPKYSCIGGKFPDASRRILECQVELNWRTQYAGVWEYELEGITYYFIDNEFYFSGSSPYAQIHQDAEKFAFFSKAVLTVLPMIGFQPDIIHCNDWQTGLIPVFLKAQFGMDSFYRYTKTVFTIHNLKFQGRWYVDAVKDITGLADEFFSMSALESYGNANYLKGGIVFSDYITTVSETYAWEIQTPTGGEGLDGLLRTKKERLVGIVNGIDYEFFNPKTDRMIAEPLGIDLGAYKSANKQSLQEKLGLDAAEEVFLIGVVSRLAEQKGLDLIVYVLERLMAEKGIQLVVLGSGERQYEESLLHFSEKYREKMAVRIGYSEELAHQIYASADAFLMPSLFEPCGLSQLIALRYGCVPIVRETGGLKDTVVPYNESEHTGTGFGFSGYNVHEMLDTILYASNIFINYKNEWMSIVQRGMRQDYSWEHMSAGYVRLYEKLMDETGLQQKSERAKNSSDQKVKHTGKTKDETVSVQRRLPKTKRQRD